MQRREFNQLLNTLLKPETINDFCPNGLQVEGKDEIRTIVTGVTASQALIDAAIENNADAILVHHGYFWKGESQPITGMKKRRVAALLAKDINLFAYHLPLDIHPEMGNNAQLAQLLDIEIEAGLEPTNNSVAMKGRLKTPLTGSEFAKKISQVLKREPLTSLVRTDKIETIALCTGGGQGYIDLAAEQGIDAYLTGEASEQTIHSSREQNIDFFAAGHHATERYGIKALGEYLAKQHGFDVTFIDIDNPV
ncbi:MULTISPECIES: Nif3-like dinuclear metal center hexameric protein [Pseudoalteromonas]|jgi:dinuclear metal center YbgI/SA1388 family protein|uniref:GTP cyclohydrolase 1 type 2 homolog n=1 Tax=Pseudoalteromonas tetraodonis TaxID=43659 RepID=A0ABD4ESM3_9GAMM|nr:MULTISPECIES: Nif3-like dinuclear metal center hexameric protein [Pseudoalteromonas]MAY58328.1 Nif3-like dinuclear metal center hexameric protein [Pseudoalteromonas sp.]KYL36019.1 Nif3-like dinuclear metal center hexameric protein [Pseudoalteromonas spiralis]MDN3393784.1 Nif3-like dinuclear metal center hexameric protein [Pseudoalteromonas sp. APC 3215]MDN3400524.1 Nif3-like dinuclear metal center hexameric protein [Pseudoalteromonas sp. APC 3213]MDN3405317.1 Nif3-like dinuclear metal cente|tara:strand:+ start:16381 stop:17133 length:753 start_codon:yes stop_codon:yes gene_type:complete